MNFKALSFVVAASLTAGAVGGAVGYRAASAAITFPQATFAPVSSTLKAFVIDPDHLKGIRITGENLDYWFVNESTGKEAIVRVPVRVMVGTIKK
jgi:hypothetical protein